MKIKITLFLLSFLMFSGILYSQNYPPANTSCTSKDLKVVSAKLTEGNICNSCETGELINRTLTLGIKNTKGSIRTSFAFLGILEVYNGVDGSLISSTNKTGCGGPVLPGAITSLDFGSISYKCGEILKISNIWLNWSTSNGKEVCPIDPNTISPKCGEVLYVIINTGVNAEFYLTSSQCGFGTGTINLTPLGGTPGYSYLWSASAGGVVELNLR